MLSAGEWRKNQPNTVLFVLVDENGLEIVGIGTTFDVYLSKAGAAFAASAGTKAEVGRGWYSYTATAAEANTSGPIAIAVEATGALQQNLEYVVEHRVVTAIPFTYTVNQPGPIPIPGVYTYFYADLLQTQLVWTGLTDALGVARDQYGNLPNLEPGTYYIVNYKPGYTFNNPDIEEVSDV